MTISTTMVQCVWLSNKQRGRKRFIILEEMDASHTYPIDAHAHTHVHMDACMHM